MNTNDIKIIREALKEGLARSIKKTDPLFREAFTSLDRLEAQQPRVRYRSQVSGLWYETLEAAGDVDCVEVDGVQFCQENGAECLTSQQQPKRLTDEEISRRGEAYRSTLHGTSVQRIAPNMVAAYNTGMRHARDHGYLGGLSVEEVMEVHRKWMDEVDCYDDWNPDAIEDLRARLYAKLSGTLS